MRWVELQLGDAATVIAWRRLTGGLSSTVHRLRVDQRGRRRSVVLRRFENVDGAERVTQEAVALERLSGAGLPTPELLGADDGRHSGGRPALLMSRVPGRIELAHSDSDRWLRQMAATAAVIHDLPIAASAFEAWFDPDQPSVPRSATRPKLWRSAFDVLSEQPPTVPSVFIHRDFQHFNMLWSRGRLSGVVDWIDSSSGPSEIDVGHCRLNLAVLYGSDTAEGFRRAYEAETGRAVEPWWDLHAAASYGDAWLEFIPIQVDKRVPVHLAGMTSRVEQLIAATMHRL